MQETVRQHDMEGEEATPIIDQEVIFVTIQSLPHIILKRSLLIHRDSRGRPSLQLPVHGSGLSLSLVYNHERHFSQVAAVQLVTQASNVGRLSEAELSGGLQQRHHHHLSQLFLHGCTSLYGPVGGWFADPGGIIVPLHEQSDM